MGAASLAPLGHICLQAAIVPFSLCRPIQRTRTGCQWSSCYVRQFVFGRGGICTVADPYSSREALYASAKAKSAARDSAVEDGNRGGRESRRSRPRYAYRMPAKLAFVCVSWSRGSPESWQPGLRFAAAVEIWRIELNGLHKWFCLARCVCRWRWPDLVSSL